VQVAAHLYTKPVRAKNVLVTCLSLWSARIASTNESTESYGFGLCLGSIAAADARSQTAVSTDTF
jgi:hypothetical protein